ncbi:helicase domain protein [Magnetococcus marinus MC-1]|uniref:RNA helicase n=1 Tax=Magnetococcus marinus (strain ATCC BAA-1437 / JCM 17883 / MC-1) TaxID=156889 RepID=A0L663_MAGMM|nr:DEAD/DEAH box helicase [Magnetococcus marinus]ABK43456.1 helicase domain protein [Magnetococcus marinus MC-1]
MPETPPSPLVLESPAQEGWIAEERITCHQWIPPEVEPVEREGRYYYALKDIVPLRSRKAWKKKGRRIPQDAEPLSHTEGEHPTPLFAYHQSVNEREFLELQREAMTERCAQWNQAWLSLDEARSDLLSKMGEQRPEEVEFDLQELLRRYRELVDQHAHLLRPARELELDLGELTHAIWFDTLNAYRRYRDQAALEDLEERNDALARPILEQMRHQEQESQDPFALQPFWEFYGKFHKRYEGALFEHQIAKATRIEEFHNLFPARENYRRFTLYLGPTNSGKTYQALQRLKDAATGCYLAPLRLLALEVADTLNEWGVPCSMVTGEERILVQGAKHTASTIEMLSTHTRYDVAVIDEAQMVGDADRGWAWTQAILGVRAKEVCVIAAPSARPVIEKLLRLTEEPWDVVELERLTPLQTMSKPVEALAEMEPGTALVAFSRAQVLRLKAEVEQATGKKCAALYGALPPEVRRMQARLFNSGEAPYLVATDAIGMGLNLPIKTILFAQDRKMINRTEHLLTPMEVRQIAGRAGRFGKNEVGYVGTYRIGTAHIKQALLAVPFDVKKAHLAPNLDHLTAIAQLQEDQKLRLTRLFTLFIKTVKPDPALYELADLDDQTTLARIADRHKQLDLPTRFMLSAAPVPLRATVVVTAFEHMVAAIAKNSPITLQDALPTPPHKADPNRLVKLEDAVKIVNLYCWLHFRQEQLFPDLAEAEGLRAHLNTEINTLLGRPRKVREAGHCDKCHAPLPEHWRGKLCRRCEPPGRRHTEHPPRGGRKPIKKEPNKRNHGRHG